MATKKNGVPRGIVGVPTGPLAAVSKSDWRKKTSEEIASKIGCKTQTVVQFRSRWKKPKRDSRSLAQRVLRWAEKRGSEFVNGDVQSAPEFQSPGATNVSNALRELHKAGLLTRVGRDGDTATSPWIYKTTHSTPQSQRRAHLAWARRNPKKDQARKNDWAKSAAGKAWLKANQAKKNERRKKWREAQKAKAAVSN